MSLHKMAVVIAVVVASLNCGCAAREGSMAQLDGSEPQRLSFGDPKTVHTNFTEKVRACWFGGSSPLLRGYRYDTVALSNAADNPPDAADTPHILVFLGEAPVGEAQQKAAFEVEFHAFNGNTLITTRNLSLPFETAARLKKDVEIWVFGDKGCGSPNRAQVATAPSPAARKRAGDASATASTHFQPASFQTGAMTGAHLASASTGMSIPVDGPAQ
jgi:hypothetical protein